MEHANFSNELWRLKQEERAQLRFDLSLHRNTVIFDRDTDTDNTLRFKYNQLVDLVLQLKDRLDERTSSP